MRAPRRTLVTALSLGLLAVLTLPQGLGIDAAAPNESVPTNFDEAAERPGVVRTDIALTPGTTHYQITWDHRTDTIRAQGVAATAGPGSDLAYCIPTETGLHHTTTMDQQDECPFTWFDGPVRTTTLGCAAAGDCSIAGQDGPTGDVFWIICSGSPGHVHAWGQANGATCLSGRTGSSPSTWTHWHSWCRMQGLFGAAVCANLYDRA